GWQPLQRTPTTAGKLSDGHAFKRSGWSRDCGMLPRLFDSVESSLENFEVAGVAGFFARSLDPFLLQRILRWSVRFVEDAEDAGKGNCGEFVRGDFIRDVMPQFVLGCAVPFLFLNDFEAAALFWIGWIEYVREKFDAFRQTFDDAEALVIERALNQLQHVRRVRSVRARDECGAAGDQLFHRVDRLIDCAGRIGLALESDGRCGRRLFLRQTIDEVVHDEIRHVDVLARPVIKMIASDGETVAVATEEEHVKIGPGETN